MKFASVRDFRSQTSKMFRELANQGEMVITKNGRPVGIISSTDEDNFEQSLNDIRQVRAARSVKQMQETSIASGLDKLTLSEINKQIAATRKGRRQ